MDSGFLRSVGDRGEHFCFFMGTNKSIAVLSIRCLMNISSVLVHIF